MQLHPASATGLHWHDRKPASAWSPRQRDGTADAKQDQPSPRHQAAGRPRHTGPVRRYLGCLRRPKEARLALHGPSPAIPETCWARPTAQP